MLNFNAYNPKDLQHCMQVLNECEAAGVTDIRFVREALHKQLYSSVPRIRKLDTKKSTIDNRRGYRCPECTTIMHPAKGMEPGTYTTVDGKLVMVCPKCRYSEVVK
jgi:hypothetical protein